MKYEDMPEGKCVKCGGALSLGPKSRGWCGNCDKNIGQLKKIVQEKPADPFHAGRLPLEKHYIRTMAPHPDGLTDDERFVLKHSRYTVAFTAVCMMYPASGLNLQEADAAIASLIAKGLVREVEVRLT